MGFQWGFEGLFVSTLGAVVYCTIQTLGMTSWRIRCWGEDADLAETDSRSPARCDESRECETLVVAAGDGQGCRGTICILGDGVVYFDTGTFLLLKMLRVSRLR